MMKCAMLVRACIGVALVGLIGGCGSSFRACVAADLAAFDGPQEVAGDGVAAAFARRPAATFPAVVAAARVQSYGEDRSVATQEDYERVAGWRGIDELVLVNRLMFSESRRPLNERIREAAAKSHADIVAVYTLDTDLETRDFMAPIGMLSLGLLPTLTVETETVASCILVDVRTGFIYGSADGRGSAEQPANGWSLDEAKRDASDRSGRRAFEAMLDQVELAWGNIVPSS